MNTLKAVEGLAKTIADALNQSQAFKERVLRVVGRFGEDFEQELAWGLHYGSFPEDVVPIMERVYKKYLFPQFVERALVEIETEVSANIPTTAATEVLDLIMESQPFCEAVSAGTPEDLVLSMLFFYIRREFPQVLHRNTLKEV